MDKFGKVIENSKLDLKKAGPGGYSFSEDDKKIIEEIRKKMPYSFFQTCEIKITNHIDVSLSDKQHDEIEKHIDEILEKL